MFTVLLLLKITRTGYNMIVFRSQEWKKHHWCKWHPSKLYLKKNYIISALLYTIALYRMPKWKKTHKNLVKRPTLTLHWLWNSTIIKTLCTLCTLYSVHYEYSILKVMLNVWNSYVYKAWSTSWARSKHSNSIINPRSNLSIKSSLKTMANIYQTAYNIVEISKRHSIRIFDNTSANLLTIHWSWIMS